LYNDYQKVTNENRLLRENEKDYQMKDAVRTNQLSLEKEKTAVWKKAYDKEVNKSLYEKISYVVVAVIFYILGKKIK
jgi:hypothetical protein